MVIKAEFLSYNLKIVCFLVNLDLWFASHMQDPVLKAMASFLRLISLLCLPILFAVSVNGSVSEGTEEDFSEDLLLKPLPDRKVLAHFHFQSRAPSSRSNSYGRHHHLFPKAISQLVLLVFHSFFFPFLYVCEMYQLFSPMPSRLSSLKFVEK